MIFYFSGTGNSKWVARQLAADTNQSLFFIPDELKQSRGYTLAHDEMIGFVFPIYSWGVPPIVLRFIAQLALDVASHHYIYFVATCGDETGMAPQQFRRAIARKGWECKAGFSITMPNNYVLLPGFDVDVVDVMEAKLVAAPTRLAEIISCLNNQFEGFDCVLGSWAVLKTRVVYPLFVKWGISPKKFFATDSCNGCKRCAKTCPVCNIVVESKPKWGSECTSCLACYHICPQRAIQYGGGTRNKGQYFHP